EYRIMVKANSKPVFVVESMYEMLCRTHAEMNQHAGQKQLWLSMKENWGWLKQDIIE
ncbi:6567_t:CDS:1, partial [Funneliformis geosporum]